MPIPPYLFLSQADLPPTISLNLLWHFGRDFKMPVVLNLLLFYHERDINKIPRFPLTDEI
jgi:hypothetical protein